METGRQYFSSHEEMYEPASMGKRLVAALIDYGIIAAILVFIVIIIEGFFYVIYPGIYDKPQDILTKTSVKGVTALLFITIFTLYYSLMESSRYQATFGKMILGLSVTDYDGNGLRFLKAFIRTLSKFISNSCFYFGYILGFFNSDHRMLHDMIAHTYVLQRIPIGDLPLEEPSGESPPEE